MTKNLLCAFLAIPTLSFGATFAYEASVPVDHIYSPSGFDSNDNTEVVITGYLPNLCYKAPKAVVSVTGGKIGVAVTATRNNNAMGFCANIKIPFAETVKIGVLDKGNYKIAVNETNQWIKIGNIKINEASSNSINDVVYANVEEVVRADETGRTVLLKGYNPSDCFVLKEIEIVDNGIDTYSVLPKMKQIRPSCPMKMVPFTYEVEVPQKLEADKVLLHVRVMDGRAVNAFFNNKPVME